MKTHLVINNKNQNSIFYKHLNFTIMKKQFLILVLFVLAAFANVGSAYGQCVDDALHPIAGKLYHYIISPSGGGTVKSIQWAVTTSPNIVNAGTFVTTIAPGATTFAWSNETTADVSITWSPTIIAAALAATPTDYYVAVKYVATNSEGCDVDNVKVYKITPVNLFQIDLANVKSDGTTLASGNVCTSTVVTATITPGASPTVAYDYGNSNMYVKVSAKYFSGSWDMLVDAALLTNLGAPETAVLSWSRTIGGSATTVTTGTAITIPEVDADPTNTEDIYLTFAIDHNSFEGLAGQAFRFKIDGKDKAGLDDVSATCAAEADEVTQNMLARPTIGNGTSGSGTNTTFITKNP